MVNHELTMKLLHDENPKSVLRTVPTNSKVFLRGFMNMRENQISTSVIKIQKENWGSPGIFRR